MKHKIAMVGNNLQMMCNFRLEVMIALVQSGYEVIVIAPQSAAADTLLQHNIRHIPITIQPRSINPLKDLVLLRQLVTIYQLEQFDFIFHYTTKIVLYGSIAARLTNRPQIPVMTGLGVIFSQPNVWSKILLKLYKLAFRRAVEVWFLNPFDQQLFIDNKILPTHQTFVLPSEGVNTTHYNTTLPLPTQPFTFVYIGRLLKEKGIEELIKATQTLQTSDIHFQVYLVGPINESKSAVSKEQIIAWEQAGLIRYLQETNNVLPYYEQATCVILPSYREGVSRVLLEAASMSRPIIATDVPGCRDVVEDGYNGWLCRERDCNSLAMAMNNAMKTQLEQLCKMGQLGRKKVVDNFDINKISSIYISKLNKYLNTI